MMEVWEFVIKPSNYISNLCYSIFRIEPFDTCSLGCIYCYARWYRGPHGKPKPKWYVVREFEKLVKKLKVKPYFRLATLSEPFQRPFGITMKILEIASKYEVPIVINTKTDVVAREALPLVKSLASKGLVLVQISLSSKKFSKLLEPLAPPVERRIKAIKVLRENKVPVVARIQPLFPTLEEEHVRVAEEALKHGAMGLIGESFRGSRRDIEVVYSILGTKYEDWEPYQLREVEGKEPIFHPSKEWRERMHLSLKHLAYSYGVPYTDCKEGCTFYGYDCCLASLFMNVPLRLTLRDLLVGLDCEERLCDLEGPLGRALRMHTRKVFKSVKLKERLCQVELCPPCRPPSFTPTRGV